MPTIEQSDAAWQDVEDWLTERISDSLDVDWRPIDAARAIIAALPKDEV